MEIRAENSQCGLITIGGKRRFCMVSFNSQRFSVESKSSD